MIALVHSPLTGPSAWEAVAASLRGRGLDAATPTLTEAIGGPGPYYAAVADAVRDQLAAAGTGTAVTLVAHSGAGSLLPPIAAAVPRVDRAVFVDALLPHPGTAWFDTVPEAMRDRLLGLADGDRLPRWSDWFPPEVIAELLPDAERRHRFIEELPRVPLAYFEEPSPEVAAWPPPHCDYVRLSDAYDEEAAKADRLGWEVHRLDGHHLSIVTKPEPVAELIERIVRS